MIRELTEDEKAMKERNRLHRRKELKAKLLATKLAASRRDQLERSIKEIEIEIDALSSDHALACEPLQAKVKEIENQQLAQMERKEPFRRELEELRRQTVKEIQSLTVKLEAEVTKKQHQLAALHAERNEAARRH